jgi:hypothetical protein
LAAKKDFEALVMVALKWLSTVDCEHDQWGMWVTYWEQDQQRRNDAEKAETEKPRKQDKDKALVTE